MSQLIWLARERLLRTLQESAARIFVHANQPGVEGLEDLCGQYAETVVPLHVGKVLTIPAPVFFFEHHCLTDVVVGGFPRRVTIPYRSILKVERFLPPTGGGGRKVRVAV